MKNYPIINSIVIVLCLGLIIFRFISPPLYMLTWDVFGYYLYLLAKFIYHDLQLVNQDWITEIINKYEPTATLYQAVKINNGNWVIKYTMGSSILLSPFFFLAHLLAQPLGYAADGFSLPYQYILTVGGLTYAFIGLIFLSRILKYYFNQITSILVMLVIFFGTNYFQLTAFDGTLLSHNFVFTFYAIMVYYTIKWHEDQKVKYMIWIGLSCGIITLVRPSEIVCLIIPVLWNIGNKSDFQKKLELLKRNIFHIVVFIISVFIVFIPQIIYWKTITGEYLFYSYTNAGEGFDFLSPHTIPFLFSFRKGWFIYTPIMLFALIGLYHLYKKNRNLFYAILVFLIIDIYIISSWTCWWYAGGSFSSRSLVPAYVLLAIPLGYFIDKLLSSKMIVKITITSIAALLVLLNLFQTWQFENGILSKMRMTKEYYFATFGKTKLKEEDNKLLLVNRSVETYQELENENEYTKRELYVNTFDENTDEILSGCLKMNDKVHFSPGIDLKYHELTNKDHAWIRASAKIFIPDDFSDKSPLLVATFHHNGKTYKYVTKSIDKDSLKTKSWNFIQLDYLTPEVRSKEDNLKVYLWHQGKEDIFVDDIEIYAFEPK